MGQRRFSQCAHCTRSLTRCHLPNTKKKAIGHDFEGLAPVSGAQALLRLVPPIAHDEFCAAFAANLHGAADQIPVAHICTNMDVGIARVERMVISCLVNM